MWLFSLTFLFNVNYYYLINFIIKNKDIYVILNPNNSQMHVNFIFDFFTPFTLRKIYLIFNPDNCRNTFNFRCSLQHIIYFRCLVNYIHSAYIFGLKGKDRQIRPNKK